MEFISKGTEIQGRLIFQCETKEIKLKIKLFYSDISKYTKHCISAAPEILRTFEILDAPDSVKKAYRQYLLSTLESDFFGNRHGDCDYVLNEVSKLIKGKMENLVFEFDGFTHHVNRTAVTFEHAIFGVCPHWPLWSCPLSHYKIALQAARDFFALPESLGTEVIVELPESDMAKIALFPPRLFENEAAKEASRD